MWTILNYHVERLLGKASQSFEFLAVIFIHFWQLRGAVHRRIWLGDARCISGMWRPWPGSFAGRYALGVHTVGKDMSCESLQDVARKLATRPRFQTCNVQTWLWNMDNMGIYGNKVRFRNFSGLRNSACVTPLAQLPGFQDCATLLAQLVGQDCATLSAQLLLTHCATPSIVQLCNYTSSKEFQPP